MPRLLQAGKDADEVGQEEETVEGEMDTVTRMTEASMFRAKHAEEPVPDDIVVHARLRVTCFVPRFR